MEVVTPSSYLLVTVILHGVTVFQITAKSTADKQIVQRLQQRQNCITGYLQRESSGDPWIPMKSEGNAEVSRSNLMVCFFC